MNFKPNVFDKHVTKITGQEIRKKQDILGVILVVTEAVMRSDDKPTHMIVHKDH